MADFSTQQSAFLQSLVEVFTVLEELSAEDPVAAVTTVAAAAIGIVSSPPFISTMGIEFADGGKGITDTSGLYPTGAPPPRIGSILPPALGSMDAFAL
jgi:hypothetical protein